MVLWLFAQTEKMEPLPNLWTMVIQAGAMGLLAFGVVYLLPTFLKNMWDDRDKERAERTRREELAAGEREKDREGRHQVASSFQKVVIDMHQHFDQVLEKLEDRFDRRLLQAIEQVKLIFKERSPS